MPATSAPAVSSKAALFGSEFPATMASRTITLAPGMRYVNVTSSDTVTFQSGGQTMTWTFAEFVTEHPWILGLISQACRMHKGCASTSTTAACLPAAKVRSSRQASRHVRNQARCGRHCLCHKQARMTSL
ncbi:CzcE family metal-binding protein [Cupriavidus basilensis]